MKKQLIILSALTVFGSPMALANDSEITREPLPLIQQQAEPEIDLSSQTRKNSAAINAAVEEAVAEAASVIRVYNYIQHVDLRDVVKYDKEIKKKLPDSADRLPGTSKKILAAVLANTERFIGDPSIKYYEDGAKGPSEMASDLSRAERKKKPFVIGTRYNHTFNNALFSVDYIAAKEIAPSVIEADLLLFAHSDLKGPFFKKLTVVVDWKKNKTHGLEDVVSIKNSSEDILLSETNFVLKGSIADQKIILEDQNNSITKVFPVTVGAIDARDSVVESMNFHVPASNRRAARKAGLDPKLQEEFQDFSNAALINRRVWDTGGSWANTSERVKPYDYKGRPFMALVDLNYVNLNAEKVKYSTGYREVGIHYQITSSRLERGFRSHGCVRVRDKDLYQVDAIVNQGPKDLIRAVFKKDLPEYDNLNHPHTYNKNVAMVKYTDKNAAAYRNKEKSESVLCKLDPSKSRRVRWNNADIKDYHTVIGNDCLTSTAKETGITSADVKAYWNGTGDRIKPFILSQEHGPVQRAKDTLLQYNYHPATIEAMSHKQRLETVAGVQNGTISPFNNGGFAANNDGLDTQDDRSNDRSNDRDNERRRNGFGGLIKDIFQQQPAQPKNKWTYSGINPKRLIPVNKANKIAKKLNKKQRVKAKNKKKYYQRIYVKYCVEAPAPRQYESRCQSFKNAALQ